MRHISALLMLLLVVPFVCAQLPEGGIIPPPLPDEQEISLTLELFDSISKIHIKNIHAHITLTSKDKTINTLKYVADDAKLKINLYPGEWDCKILIDDINTPGKDYVYDTTIYLNEPKLEKIYLFPAGSIQGMVLIDDNAVPLANVLLYCSGTNEIKKTVTDITGSFVFDWAPIGTCKAVSVFKSARGEASINITKGSLSENNILLTKNVVQDSNLLFYILIIILSGLCIFFFVKIKKPKKKPESRINDIMKTLNPKEKKIVNFLLENNHHSTQSVIKNNLDIPKTTLIRIFQALENKNIVSIERIGKMKKLALTDWFVEKIKH